MAARITLLTLACLFVLAVVMVDLVLSDGMVLTAVLLGWPLLMVVVNSIFLRNTFSRTYAYTTVAVLLTGILVGCLYALPWEVLYRHHRHSCEVFLTTLYVVAVAPYAIVLALMSVVAFRKMRGRNLF